MFTPLLKELLLIIIIYTIRWERGVSSEKLNELLWFDKSEKDARNNRSVNMAKLRSILEKVGSCQISKETGYWKLLPVEGELFIDYREYMNILRRKDSLDKELVNDLMKIIDRGTFLSNADYEWVDDMKSEISNEIISILLRFANTNGIERDTDFVIRLINYVFNFDLVNEEAMIIKCRSLVYLRKHSLAHRAFEKFKRDYKSLYGEDYAGTFQDVVESR
jgi:two-component SAPR family response regulator